MEEIKSNFQGQTNKIPAITNGFCWKSELISIRQSCKKAL